MVREMIPYWIWLQQLLGPASPLADRFLESGFTPRELYDNRRRIGELIEGLPGYMIRRFEAEASCLTEEKIQRWRRELGALRLQVLTPDMEQYPALLRGIFSPPLALYYWGDPWILRNTVPIAIVGPRHATDYGVEAAKRIAFDLARCGVKIVSGHAIGVDSACHEGALAAGGKTVMVLACGHDVEYPFNSMILREQVAKRGGLVLSEYLPGEWPAASHFAGRNRLLSGLAMGTVVVEAGEKSGALITANHALEQGRDLFCVTSSIFNPNGIGVAKLLREGAKAVTGAADILLEYLYLYPERIQMARLPKAQRPLNGGTPAEEQPKRTGTKKKGKKPRAAGVTVKKPQLSDQERRQAALEFLPEESRIVLEKLETGQAHMDELTACLGEKGGKALATLTELEILGLVQSLPGGYYKVC